MKLNARDVQILKNFSGLNPSIAFKKGSSQATMHTNKAVIARAALSVEIQSNFAIFDLSKFIGTLSLFADPQLEPKEGFLTISEKGQKVNFTFCNPEMIIVPKQDHVVMPTEDCQFKLVDTALSQLLRASGVLSLPHVVIIGDGETVTIGAENVEDPSADKYMVEVGLTKAEFRYVFKIENFRLLPGTYNVTLSQKGKLGCFQGTDVAYWVATEAKLNKF